VRNVVEAEAEDVLERPRYRRVQPHRLERAAGVAHRFGDGSGTLPLRRASLDQRQQ